MPKTAIITDSCSGITQQQAKELGIQVVPMPFTINKKEYLEDINLTQDAFYEMLGQGAEVATSQPSLGTLASIFDETLKSYDEIVYLPMSSGLSGAYQSAKMLSEDYDEQVYVVNNQRISATLEQDVYDAIEYVRQGKSAREIKQLLEDNRFNCTIYITVDTLEYLKKGGRITPAVAAIGSLLKIKPILNIYGEKLDKFAIARTLNKAESIMIDAIAHDIETRIDIEGKGDNVYLCIAHTNCPEVAEKLKEKMEKRWPGHEVRIVPLALAIACHTGPGAIGAGCIKKVFNKKDA
ncbi:DegV domain-containing protein [Clostridiales bacterium CHKCI006]|nr:DegV domain-containing protein [Clostridiales bacterium CHKCI006]